MNLAELKKEGLSYDFLSNSFSKQNLFENKEWIYSPSAYGLTSEQLDEITQIGFACYEFYRALEILYFRSLDNKYLLRNGDLKIPWVSEYLNRGKPDKLIKCGRSNFLKGKTPPIIRPDLLITENGFTLTEMDSIPGGIGLTAFLNEIYHKSHREDIISFNRNSEDMIDSFYRVLKSRSKNKTNPFIAIIVSDEALTYRPEMEFLADKLRKRGHRVNVFHPKELMIIGDIFCVSIDGGPQEIDVIYRFWELFDMDNIPLSDELLEKNINCSLEIAPPIRCFQEEKISLALFHHRILEDFWRENLSEMAFKMLKRIIPMTWILDPVDLPPNAVLDAPYVNGKPISRWEELIMAVKKDRNLIIKISGFHETAWGAKSITLGSDSSSQDWGEAINNALDMSKSSLHILQVYIKPKRLNHPVYDNRGNVINMNGRMRLCPYYFVDSKKDKVDLRGILATLCPADKKIIHGMKDASLIPCKLIN